MRLQKKKKKVQTWLKRRNANIRQQRWKEIIESKRALLSKTTKKSEMEHQIVCNTVKLDKRFYNIKNFLVTYGPYFSQYSKHCVGKDFE